MAKESFWNDFSKKPPQPYCYIVCEDHEGNRCLAFSWMESIEILTCNQMGFLKKWACVDLVMKKFNEKELFICLCYKNGESVILEDDCIEDLQYLKEKK